MQRIREKLLVFQVSEGRDPRAYGELYNLYFERIRRFIFFKVNVHEEVEDLTSQVFLKAWEYLIDLDQRRVQNFRAFIYQLTRNIVVDYYRRQGRAPEMVVFEDQAEENEIPDHRQEFFLTQMYKSDRAYIADCLKKLKDEYKDAVVLRYLEDLGIAEIADIMGKTQGNVRVLIHRGLKELREVIGRSPSNSS